jgi:hypothetical protein
MMDLDPMFNDFIDYWIKKTYKLSDEEWEFIQNNLTDREELEDFTCIFKTTGITFEEKRRALKAKNNLISRFIVNKKGE